MSAKSKGTMSTEALLAMDDGVMDRWLINGERREKPLEFRSRQSSYAMTRLAHELETWVNRQPSPRGQVFCGDAGVILQRDPDTTVWCGCRLCVG